MGLHIAVPQYYTERSDNMNTIMEYLDWRGDLSFDASPFNDVDNLILAELSYLNMPKVEGKSTIEKVAKRYLEINNVGDKDDKRTVSNLIRRIEKLFIRVAKTDRFSNVVVSDYINKFDEVKQSQFSAMLFTISERLAYVAFRGTDDTLIGFKEDFNMSFSTQVQGQIDSVKYLKYILEKYKDKKIIVGGHSKGGNFAVYAVASLEDEQRDRIIQVYNNDGPGFAEEFINSKGYEKTVNKVKKFLPKGSVVGILMNDNEKYYVVNAKGNTGFTQHDGLNWEVLGTEFVTVKNLNDQSVFFDETLKKWLDSLDEKEKTEFVDSVYYLVKGSTSATRYTDITNNRMKSSIKILKGIADMDDEKKEVIQGIIYKLIKSGTEVRRKEERMNRIMKLIRKEAK